MADRQWFIPGVGQIHEEGTEEYFVPGGGEIAEDQAAAVAAAYHGLLLSRERNKLVIN